MQDTADDRVWDQRFMRRALHEAKKGLGSVSPNPAVGAVIVREGEILATGFHRRAGLPHAEVEAIRNAGGPNACHGTTLYVTLEPCSTSGRTPPCTEAIVAAGIRRIVIGAIDPNPIHRGQGLVELRQRGVEVTEGVLAPECSHLNAGFNRWIQTGRPWVIVKVAQSLDGYLTRLPSEPRWLTNKHSRSLVHRLRASVDAVLVGAATLRSDNPQLTVRPPRGNRQPWRVIVTRSGILPSNARVFTDSFRDRTLVFQNQAWDTVLHQLGERGVTRLLVEGGGEITGELLDRDLIDEIWCFYGPWLTGGNTPAFRGIGVANNEEAKTLREPRFLRLDNDVLLIGRLHEA